MFFVALRRLCNRIGLTLLSIIAVTLSVGLIVSTSVFAKAVSFVMLHKELSRISIASKRPPFSMRTYVLLGGHYPLSLDGVTVWEEHISETVLAEVDFPLLASRQQQILGRSRGHLPSCLCWPRSL